MLSLKALHVHLGSAHILHGIDLDVRPSEIVCLLGRNGVGKSTTLRAIMGLAAPSQGELSFEGRSIAGLPPHQICARGIAWVPEDRRVFASLTVAENIRVAAEVAGRRDARARIEAAIAPFPDLRGKWQQRAGTLSGGQQQMLAIARALAAQPRLLLLDEPSEGLAPAMVAAIRDGIVQMRRLGMSVLLVEQNLQLALDLGDVFYVLSRGTVVFQGGAQELRQSEVIAQHLGIDLRETART
ncbi:ABC transporter ATP-binding protein [Bradyrhizobium sp. HKCCYLR20261]|uniref:ABC transporter ATP-binding protein n=1 Tax=Bradyrhizobium sp. HKCCYLR20261 TaxID=3420760 RepID=UPI003EBF72AF